MRKYNNRVEIKNPPIQELRKKRSCLTRACLSGCGCVIFLIFAFLMFLKIASQPYSKELKELPQNIIDSVPIYDTKNIERIELTPGHGRGKIIERTALLPKILLAPVIMQLEKMKNPRIKTSAEKINESYFSWSEFKKIIKEPITDQRDIYHIEWSELPAQPSFIFNYYKSELKKNGFSTNLVNENQVINQFMFNKENIDGILYIKDDPIKNGTDYVLLIIQSFQQ